MYLKASQKTVTKKLAEELVILNLDSGVYYSLNKVGTKIWEMCNGTKNVDEIVDSICDNYKVGQDEAQNDVLELIEDMKREGLLMVNNTPF